MLYTFQNSHRPVTPNVYPNYQILIELNIKKNTNNKQTLFTLHIPFEMKWNETEWILRNVISSKTAWTMSTFLPRSWSHQQNDFYNYFCTFFYEPWLVLCVFVPNIFFSLLFTKKKQKQTKKFKWQSRGWFWNVWRLCSFRSFWNLHYTSP